MSTARYFVALGIEALLGLFMALDAYSLFTLSVPSMTDLLVALHYPGWYLQLAGVVATVGAIGLLVGLFIRPVGAAATLWMVCYFIVATFSHLLKGDVKDLGLPLAFLVISALLVALRWGDVTALLKSRQLAKV